MKYYIINVCEERKNTLSKHLTERGIDKKFDIHWNGKYLNTDPFVIWLKITYAKNVDINGISNHVNWFEAAFESIKLNEDFFMISDDDVVFPNDWEIRINTLKRMPMNIISEGVCYHIPYKNGYTVTGNIGGMECSIIHKEFAKFVINNIDFNQCLDIVIGSMMLHHGMQLAITPICHQTSILTKKSTMSHEKTKYNLDWITYTNTYKPSGLTYERLKKEFSEFMIKKTFAEELFFNNFDVKIDIWNQEYIDTKYLLKM